MDHTIVHFEIPAKNTEKLKILSLVTFLLISGVFSFSVSLVFATEATVRVYPDNVTVCKDEFFMVNVTLLDVSSLAGWEFKLYWNRTVLNCTAAEVVGPSEWSELNITLGPGLQPNYNATHGRYWGGFAYLYPAPTFNGSTTMATLTFKALGTGTVPLHLAGVKLSDNHQPLTNPIAHTDYDCSVTVVPPPLCMRSDQHTVNNATMYKLMETHTGNSNATSISCVDPENEYEGSWGFRVWKRSSNGTETELTSGLLVAVVTRASSGQGLQPSNWTCPAANLTSTDCLVVRVYYSLAGDPYSLSAEFLSVQLNATSLSGQAWTVYYYTKRSFSSQTYSTTIHFYWGNTYSSRIENVDYN